MVVAFWHSAWGPGARDGLSSTRSLADVVQPLTQLKDFFARGQGSGPRVSLRCAGCCGGTTA
eukprot:11163644-Lingulodinium_polyedra.AAC.1